MIIAEIGLNHLGKKSLAMKYVEQLCDADIDGLTFQVPEPDFFLDKKYKHLKIENDHLINCLNHAKSQGKKIGIAICDVESIQKFEKNKIDFYKILTKDLTNYKLIDNLLMTTNKKIYFSVGNSNYQSIEKLMSKINNQLHQVELVHTNFKGIKAENLNRINILRDKFNIPVGYGSHCKNKNILYTALAFKPSTILFYVKQDEQLNYPDNDHAFKTSEVNDMVKNIHELQKTLNDH